MTAVTDDPFDHNAECTFCDEQAMHAADCPWIAQLVAEVERLTGSERVLAELEFRTRQSLEEAEAEVERLRTDNASLTREVDALHAVVDRLHDHSPDK